MVALLGCQDPCRPTAEWRHQKLAMLGVRRAGQGACGEEEVRASSSTLSTSRTTWAPGPTRFELNAVAVMQGQLSVSGPFRPPEGSTPVPSITCQFGRGIRTG